MPSAIIQHLLLLMLFLLCSTAELPINHFLIEAKVLVNQKQLYNPINISLVINNSDPLPVYTFNLSQPNFNKNVSVVLKLYAWYNQQWISRQPATLKITDKRDINREKRHVIAKLMKFNSRKSLEFEQSIIQQSKVLVSYDPQSSLMVSRLEDPQIFNTHQSYIPISRYSVGNLSKTIEIRVNFEAVIRSDNFVIQKNHIVQLNQIAGSMKQRLPLVSRPLDNDLIEPIYIWKNIVTNIDALIKAEKQLVEKTAFLRKKNYQNLLLPSNIYHLNFTTLNAMISGLGVVIVKNDTLVPVFRYIVSQGLILDHISTIQNGIRRNLNLLGGYDWITSAETLSYINTWGTVLIGLIWTFVDILAYLRMDVSSGLSISYGYYLNIWLIVEIVMWSFRLGSISNFYFGVSCFGLCLAALKLFTMRAEGRFLKQAHQYSRFDRVVTEATFNIIIIVVIFNAARHIFFEKDFNNLELVFWLFTQFQALLQEYYYFMAMLPPILLTFKFKSTRHLGWFRMLLLVAIWLKTPWQLLFESEWSVMLLLWKQMVLVVVILVLKMFYGSASISLVPCRADEKEAEIISNQCSDEKGC